MEDIEFFQNNLRRFCNLNNFQPSFLFIATWDQVGQSGDSSSDPRVSHSIEVTCDMTINLVNKAKFLTIRHCSVFWIIEPLCFFMALVFSLIMTNNAQA